MIRGGAMLPKYFIPIIVISLLCLVACDKDPASSAIPDQYINVSLNGEASVTFGTPGSTPIAYVANDSMTIITSALEDSSAHIFIMIKGKTVGTYDMSWQEGSFEGFTFDILYAKSESEQYGASRSGSVTLTAFGDVGELVEGTFSAILTVFSDFMFTADSTQVSGSFAVVRSADYIINYPPDTAETSVKIIKPGITVSLNGGGIVTYDDPSTLRAYYDTGTAQFFVGVNKPGTSMVIIFKGNAVGTYDVGWWEGHNNSTDNFDVHYYKSPTENYSMAISGAVRVTEFGAVGDSVKGTYDAVVWDVPSSNILVDSAQVAGTFGVLREADIQTE
jgi:hypothetical protein